MEEGGNGRSNICIEIKYKMEVESPWQMADVDLIQCDTLIHVFM